ncbi:YlxM family DNA-binding protein [Anaerovibrio lipolyticus]|jgi:predicted DNA-binding protein YlxM (UPF0122 family)|uniref:YlxM family DNA-binding protein n=1 Tax=Anaerovibrio lipolyticus TaxID=82374 RepID=UPI00048670FB|nr:sigma factor-like helix-turn-helix DNA-binding protein [Anaerovibrio lipolyticus]
MLEQRLYLAELFDIYGPLLTDKQQKCLSMHLFEDFSMSEIGEDLAVSRQAVYDILHRSEQTMAAYEKKLGLAQRLREQRHELTEIYDDISQLSSNKKIDEKEANHILMKLAPYTSKVQEELD